MSPGSCRLTHLGLCRGSDFGLMQLLLLSPAVLLLVVPVCLPRLSVAFSSSPSSFSRQDVSPAGYSIAQKGTSQIHSEACCGLPCGNWYKRPFVYVWCTAWNQYYWMKTQLQRLVVVKLVSFGNPLLSSFLPRTHPREIWICLFQVYLWHLYNWLLCFPGNSTVLVAAWIFALFHSFSLL